MTEPKADSRVSSSWLPATNSDREALREQVGRILASALFRNSKRFPNLLRHTVEHALGGGTEPLKERTLGIEVFGRTPDYDTAQDPVVRMTAVEVRKRLTQYYAAPEHQHEIRIEFPSGSYLPLFHPAPPTAPESPSLAASRARGQVRIKIRQTMSIACGVLILALVIWRLVEPDPAFHRFWEPVLTSPEAVLLCLGDPRITLPDGDAGAEPAGDSVAGGTTVMDVLRRDSVRFSDALTLSMLAGFLRSKDKAYRVARTGSTDLEDLREGPVVLIGLTDNPWTLRVLEPLRFGFAAEGGRRYIKDRQNPGNRKWGHDGFRTPIANMPEAYGIITRVRDAAAGRFVVTAAGLLWGTRAAGECLTEPACLEQAARLAPGDWRHKNIQIVISAKVVGENSGPPQVLAAYLW